jgi:hypothetical protein
MFTRLKDDTCAYQKQLTESTSTLNHLLDPSKYYNCNPCRINDGIVGGNSVSVYSGNLVDLESDLRGQTRYASKCPSLMFEPGTNVQGRSGNNCPDNCSAKNAAGIPCIASCKQNLVHLPECVMLPQKPRINNTGIYLDYPECAPLEPVLPAKLPPAPRLNTNWMGQQGIYQ